MELCDIFCVAFMAQGCIPGLYGVLMDIPVESWFGFEDCGRKASHDRITSAF